MKLDISMSVYHNEYNIFTVYTDIHTCMHVHADAWTYVLTSEHKFIFANGNTYAYA